MQSLRQVSGKCYRINNEAEDTGNKSKEFPPFHSCSEGVNDSWIKSLLKPALPPALCMPQPSRPGALTGPSPSKNRTCEFPRIRLRHLKGRFFIDPAALT